MSRFKTMGSEKSSMTKSLDVMMQETDMNARNKVIKKFFITSNCELVLM